MQLLIISVVGLEKQETNEKFVVLHNGVLSVRQCAVCSLAWWNHIITISLYYTCKAAFVHLRRFPMLCRYAMSIYVSSCRQGECLKATLNIQTHRFTNIAAHMHRQCAKNNAIDKAAQRLAQHLSTSAATRLLSIPHRRLSARICH